MEIIAKSQNSGEFPNFDWEEPVNSLTRDNFIIYDSVDDRTFTMDFESELLNEKWKYWCKASFVQLSGGWTNNITKTLSNRFSTAKNHHNALLRIGCWASENKINHSMVTWSEEDVCSLILAVLKNEVYWSKNQNKTKKLLSRSPVDYIFLVLSKCAGFYRKGKMHDGLSFALHHDTLVLNTVTTELEQHDVTYDKWISCESYTSIPLPIAMAFLGESIEIIRSENTKFLCEFYSAMRSPDLTISSQVLFYKSSSIMAYMNGTSKRNDIPYKKGLPHNAPHNFYGRIDHLKGLFEKYKIDISAGFPFTEGKLSEMVQVVYDACAVILLCITGMRISELASLEADSFEKLFDDVAAFSSRIKKTNHGISTCRDISPIGVEVSDILNQLSFIDKKEWVYQNKPIHLFARTFRPLLFRELPKLLEKQESRIAPKHSITCVNSFSVHLSIAYERFLVKYSEFKEIHPHVHPHQFRHTFAEFALRRFEGDVWEAVRRHFRHAFKSQHTHHYLFGKLNDEILNIATQDYMKELLKKIIKEQASKKIDSDFHADLIGGSAYYISKAFDLDNLLLLSPEEMDNYVDDVAENFNKVEAHEYGYCLVRKDIANQANCYDKKTGFPNTSFGESKLCLSCPNFIASESNNKEALIRIGVQHTNVIKAHKSFFGDNVNSKTIEASRRGVKQVEKILAQME